MIHTWWRRLCRPWMVDVIETIRWTDRKQSGKALHFILRTQAYIEQPKWSYESVVEQDKTRGVRILYSMGLRLPRYIAWDFCKCTVVWRRAQHSWRYVDCWALCGCGFVCLDVHAFWWSIHYSTTLHGRILSMRERFEFQSRSYTIQLSRHWPR